MRCRASKRVLSALLALVMVIGLLPTVAFPALAGHKCPNCDDWIDGSPYCEDCYECADCCELCIQCGKCSDCSGWEICSGCSDEESGTICVDCAIDQGSHCVDCYDCYFKEGSWCQECGRCKNCVEICDDCTANLGEGIICVECALEKGSHCPGCEQCYFEVQGWCSLCGLCDDCSPICEFCSEWEGEVICAECAIDSNLHCPDCTECYGEANGEYCLECDVCANCREYCPTYEMCNECAIEQGYHCPTCESCADDEIICESCGERCTACADDFCENCNMCSDCVQVCPSCGACSECAEICPNCEEYCSDCEDMCDDCELCAVCCADIAMFEGCDCATTVCVESLDWEEHFAEEHAYHEDSHTARPSVGWLWDNTYHWHQCLLCESNAHYGGYDTHTYDAKGNCTVCGYVQNAKIQIIQQPTDSRSAYVQSPHETHDERNIAHFSVVAMGESTLTYTWYEGYYSHSLGKIKYMELRDEPQEGENFEGPNLSVLVATDACYSDWYVCCVITDEEGNEVQTVDALVQARHDYQYYKRWKTNEQPFELVKRSRDGHVLQCAGEGCEKVTNFRPHEDGDLDGYCDICDYEIPPIMITKQPSSPKNVYVTSPNEDYDESNIAHFSVEAIGDSELTYVWCRKTYVGGKWEYVPLTNPLDCENYDGPNLDLLAPTDACYTTYTYCCFITDEEGNEVKTIDTQLRAKHNYQYYKYYRSHEYPLPEVAIKPFAHKLQCAGEGCEKTSRFRQHIDEEKDFCCDICDYVRQIDQLEMRITLPREGLKPSYTVTESSPAYGVAGNSTNYMQYRRWYASDNGQDGWALMDSNDVFVAGKYYKFQVDVRAASGRAFETYGTPGAYYIPKVFDKSNGIYGWGKVIDGEDPAYYMTMEYSCGVCNDSVIENIAIENVVAPVTGEEATYTASASGTGYYVNTAYNRYEDDNMPWHTPESERQYYIVNGVGWFDMTAFRWMYQGETFLPGHTYQINVFVETEDDFTFYHSKYYEMLFTATVNGRAAEGNTTTSDDLYKQTIRAEFPCEAASVSAVEVSDIDVPVGGQAPDYTGKLGNETLYAFADYGFDFAGFWWYDADDLPLTDEDRFVAGETYKLEIKLTRAMAGQVVASNFITPVTATLNGKEVSADSVMANATTVYIYQTYTCKAAPTPSVKGKVTSEGSAADNITIQLIPAGTNEAAYEEIVTGNSTTYYIAGIAAGTYTLKVTKNGHATFTKAVTVSDTSLTENVTLSLQKNGWVTEGGKWAYYENGVKFVGWKLDGGKWYYLDADGYMVANSWRKDSKGWVYLGANGAMLTNAWCKDSKGWCYVGADGYCVTNCWKKDSVGWIYLDSNGSMTKSAWVKDGGKWYYLNENGYMAANQWIQDGGKWYFVDTNGVMMANAWKKDSTGWVYLGANGAMLTNAWVKDSVGWCYVGADGYCVTNCWKKDSKGWCYLDANGRMVMNDWVQDSHGWCWLDASGYWNGVYY